MPHLNKRIQNIDFCFKRVRYVPHLNKQIQDIEVCFRRGEVCASPLSTNFRRNPKISRWVRHMPHLKKQIQNIESFFQKK